MTLNEVNITCPHTHTPLVTITRDGITIRCQHCTMQEHYRTWQEFDTRRAAVMGEPAQEANPEKLESISPLLLPQRRKRRKKHDDE